MAQSARTDLATFARKVSRVIQPEFRPKILAAVFLILKAQQGAVATHKHTLSQIGQALEIPAPQLDATLSSLLKAS